MFLVYRNAQQCKNIEVHGSTKNLLFCGTSKLICGYIIFLFNKFIVPVNLVPC